MNFYPRPPRGGRPAVAVGFLIEKDISIHALREEGDIIHGGQLQFKAISIHALREEGDAELQAFIKAFVEFLSTPSARRATVLHRFPAHRWIISIHALREEGDIAV